MSNNTGLKLEAVHSELNKITDEFSRFANTGDNAARMTDGLASTMNRYSRSLIDAGVSQKDTIATMDTMFHQISNLDIAQKSFISSQTGGPGGLMGGIQIEKMMREGDFEGIFKKTRETIIKQFGRIVSFDEASKSESAAAEYTQQRLMLQKGPMGQLAQTPESAGRLLEAFRTGDQSAAKGLDPTIVGKTIDKGVVIQDKTYSAITVTNNLLDQVRRSSEATALNTLQRLTIGQGAQLPAQETQREALLQRQREWLRGSRTNAGANTGSIAMDRGVSQDYSAKSMREVAMPVGDLFGSIGKMIPNMATEIYQHTKSEISKLMSKKPVSDEEKTSINDQIVKLQKNFGEKTGQSYESFINPQSAYRQRTQTGASEANEGVRQQAAQAASAATTSGGVSHADMNKILTNLAKPIPVAVTGTMYIKQDGSPTTEKIDLSPSHSTGAPLPGSDGHTAK